MLCRNYKSLHGLSDLIQASFDIWCFNIKKKSLLLCTVWQIDEQQIADTSVDAEMRQRVWI